MMRDLDSDSDYVDVWLGHELLVLLGLALQTGVVSVPRGLLAPGDQGPRLD